MFEALVKKAIRDALVGEIPDMKLIKTLPIRRKKPAMLRQREKLPVPTGAPDHHFVVSPKDVYVIDGDTITVRLMSNGASEPLNLRVRLRSVATPELPTDGLGDDILRDAGVDTSLGHPGVKARDALRDILAGRAIFVEPRGGDRHGRLLADVTASGDMSGEFEPEGAFSVESELIRLRMAAPFPGEDLPDALTIPVRCRPSDEDGRILEKGSLMSSDVDDALDWF